MNTKEFVMKTTEAGFYVPPKYMIMEVGIAGTLATSTAWIMCIGYGFENRQDYEDYSTSLRNVPEKTWFSGTIIQYEVVSLDSIQHYTTNASIVREGPWPLA